VGQLVELEPLRLAVEAVISVRLLVERTELVERAYMLEHCL
jgi:hypothetical protein